MLPQNCCWLDIFARFFSNSVTEEFKSLSATPDTLVATLHTPLVGEKSHPVASDGTVVTNLSPGRVAGALELENRMVM